jgi:polyphosphate kinase
MCLLVRQDPDGVIRRYAHIGTGNYNPVTARYYTDLSLLTCDPEITASAHNIFNYLTAHAQASSYAPLAVAPLNLSSRLLQLIQREAEHAHAERPAGIIAKMNALTDPVVIEALYRASQAGVKIDLIVRGMCSLRPGIAGVSENIHVRSIVGRFLEHSRIFHFVNGGSEELFLCSADWMPRNLYDRVEIMAPLRAPEICKRVRQEILEAYLRDNLKARVMAADGSYSRPDRQARGKTAGINAQELLMQSSGEERATPAAAAVPAEPRTVTVA